MYKIRVAHTITIILTLTTFVGWIAAAVWFILLLILAKEFDATPPAVLTTILLAPLAIETAVAPVPLADFWRVPVC